MNQTEFSNAIFKSIFVGYAKAWPLLLILFLLPLSKILVNYLIRYLEKQKLAKAGISDIDTMDGRTFEKYLVTLFEGLGYKVELTKYIGDYGADLVIAKDNIKTVVQAKRHKSKVGVKAVQEAVAAKGYYNCQKAMVVTNSHYTNQAKVLAEKNSVVFWDRGILVDNLLKIKEQKAVRADPIKVVKIETLGPEPSVTSARMSFDEFVSGKCAICGVDISDKVRRYCLDNSHRFKGNVYCFNHQKSIR